MPKFPVDAPKARVIQAFVMPGFEVVREGNDISMRRPRSSGGSDCLTMPNHSTIKASTLRTVLTQAGITQAEFPDAYEQARSRARGWLTGSKSDRLSPRVQVTISDSGRSLPSMG
jgi:hypothetical protein